MAEPQAIPGSRKSAFLRRPWSLAVLALAVAVSLAVVVMPAAWAAASVWAVLALIAFFVLTEHVQFEIEFRRQTFTVSPSEVALVIGLVEVGGVWTAVARLVALVLVLLGTHRRAGFAFGPCMVLGALGGALWGPALVGLAP